MTAERSALHCPGCSNDLLVLHDRGLFCAQCGAPVVVAPTGSGAHPVLEERLRAARQRSRVVMGSLN